MNRLRQRGVNFINIGTFSVMTTIKATAADTAEKPVIDAVKERYWYDSFWKNKTLTGDWFGQRTWLKDHGITIGLESTQFTTLSSERNSDRWGVAYFQTSPTTDLTKACGCCR